MGRWEDSGYETGMGRGFTEDEVRAIIAEAVAPRSSAPNHNGASLERPSPTQNSLE